MGAWLQRGQAPVFFEAPGAVPASRGNPAESDAIAAAGRRLLRGMRARRASKGRKQGLGAKAARNRADSNGYGPSEARLLVPTAGRWLRSQGRATLRRVFSEGQTAVTLPCNQARIIVVASTLLVSVLLGAALAWADVGDYSCADPSQVYYGNHRLFQRPCVISSDSVYQHIPEYREILRRGLTDKDPQYHLLLRKATARFSDAVKKMARKQRHDLVAEHGAVHKARKDAPEPPDRTDAVVQALD